MSTYRRLTLYIQIERNAQTPSLANTNKLASLAYYSIWAFGGLRVIVLWSTHQRRQYSHKSSTFFFSSESHLTYVHVAMYWIYTNKIYLN